MQPLEKLALGLAFIIFLAGVALFFATSPAKGDTTAWCASPGPHGEALYCTDDEKALPPVLRDIAVQRHLKGMEDFYRYTHVDVQPKAFWWLGCDRTLYRPNRWVSLAMEAVVPLPQPVVPYLRLRVKNRDLLRASWEGVCWR